MNIQTKIIALQKRIFNEGYYTDLWCKALEKHGVTAATIDQQSSASLISLANTFWWYLPDSAAIRTGPFWELCDIAEQDPADWTDQEPKVP